MRPRIPAGGFHSSSYFDVPTIIMSGSWRARRRHYSIKAILCCTCIWLNAGSISSNGVLLRTQSSHVLPRLASCFSVRVQRGGFAGAGGAGDRHMPCGWAVAAVPRNDGLAKKAHTAIRRRLLCMTSGSKMRITKFFAEGGRHGGRAQLDFKEPSDVSIRAARASC